MTSPQSFSDFTNLYELSKTLRFELKPIGKTLEMLEDAKVFKKDQDIQKKYEQTKPYFDRLHRKFMQEALKDAKLDFREYYQAFLVWKKDKRNSKFLKGLEKQEQVLRKKVVELCNIKAKSWATRYSHLNFKKKDLGIFWGEDVFALLKEFYGEEKESKLVSEETGEIISIFDAWKGFTGYFNKFQETRENFYKTDGTSTAIATRIVDQNLQRFCDNLDVFNKIKNKFDTKEVEESFSMSFGKVFSLEYYNTCFLQEGIDAYNTLLGGKTLENGEKQKGVNELINEYRQKNKGDKVPFLKMLDKQILSEKEKFMLEIETDEEFQKVLEDLMKNAEIKFSLLKSLFSNYINPNRNTDVDGIYLTRQAFNTISQRWTYETAAFEENLYMVYKDAKDKSAKYCGKEQKYTFPDFISLEYIKKSFESINSRDRFWKERYYRESNSESTGFLSGEEPGWGQFLKIFNHEFNWLFKSIYKKGTKDEKIIGYDIAKKNLERFIKKDNFTINKDSKIIIKDFADSVLWIYQMAKYFAVEKKRKWNPNKLELGEFYTNNEFGFESYHRDAYREIVQSYNLIRNYVTRKPYSEEKWKLNFENSTLANGWDKNKESDNSTVILRKDGKYFLGLMKKGHNKIFDDRDKEHLSKDINDEYYEKVVYKYLPDAAKMIPKCSTQLKEVRNHFENSSSDYELSTKAFQETFTVSRRAFELNNTMYDKSNIKHTTMDKKNGVKAFQKEYLSISENTSNYQSSLYDWIDFCKDFIKIYRSTRNFNTDSFKSTKDYQSLDEFYKDIDNTSYKISFRNISEGYIDEKNQNGELYLFQIKNKDWNEGSTGRKNLHTLYFEALFSQENGEHNFPMKLNGQAEIFYRPKTEVSKLGTKKDRQGKVVVDHKRYAKNKILFHIPTTLNRGKGNSFRFNAQMNNFLANNPEINIIGVDRGEKHIAYYSVISQKGRILDSGTLNTIKSKDKIVDYHEKLTQKADEREQNRKDWQDVQGIKDLKKGYISQVIRKLADLAIEHNAIIVFEDLNMRFKQIRGGIEKSAYQQLEKALIEKLNFLVNKGEVNPEKAGNLLKAYQLTAPFETFKDMGKQTGIIFYTQAAYTSKIDPVTGWRPNLYLKSGSAETNKEQLVKFFSIIYNADKKRFEFTYDRKKFISQKEYSKDTVWTVCSCVERFRWDRKRNSNKGGYKHYKYEDITKGMKKLFADYKIEYERDDILQQIEKLETKGNEKFFSKLIFYWKLICQIRNTDDDKAKDADKQDFILSPVEPFFDSRKSESFGKNLPKNGDDNGAFNIARKGIIVLDKISKYHKDHGDCEKLGWGDLYVSHVDWDNFAQKN